MSGSTIFITAADARANALKDQIIHSEARAIEDSILTAVKLGYYETVVSNSTIMTNGTNTTYIVSNVNVNLSNNTLTIDNHGLPTGSVVTVYDTQTLPVPLAVNTFYYTIYVDQNNIALASNFANAAASIPIPIRLTTTGNGNVLVNTFSSAIDYYTVWQNGTPSSPLLFSPYQDQMNTVINYFVNLGYTINQVTNQGTGNTFNWSVKW